jgi:hypothetical protein
VRKDAAIGLERVVQEQLVQQARVCMVNEDFVGAAKILFSAHSAEATKLLQEVVPKLAVLHPAKAFVLINRLVGYSAFFSPALLLFHSLFLFLSPCSNLRHVFIVDVTMCVLCLASLCALHTQQSLIWCFAVLHCANTALFLCLIVHSRNNNAPAVVAHSVASTRRDKGELSHIKIANGKVISLSLVDGVYFKGSSESIIQVS